jgi:AcrR family transcriptional regulator
MANEKSSPRTYRKRRRAESEARTRERITEAAVELHGTVGPASTTISEVARRAGVQRATVYRHFPDETTLFEACSAHYWARHPPPDPTPWARLGDHRRRLETGLGAIYEWYADAEPMLTATSRDRGRVPAMEPAAAAFLGYLEAVRAVLVRGRRERGRARQRVDAAAGHALDFTTWRSLVVERGLRQPEAVSLMADLIERAGARPR